jgi:hypothetical protein
MPRRGGAKSASSLRFRRARRHRRGALGRAVLNTRTAWWLCRRVARECAREAHRRRGARRGSRRR